MCSSREVPLSDMIDVIIEKINMGGTVTFTPRGESMLPMLRDGEDIVVLSKPKGRLQMYDVPLYRRDSGAFVLHRVIGFEDDGSYTMCGDNQFRKEHGIRDDQIIGVLSSFYRKGKVYSVNSVRYRLYVSLWYNSRPFRAAFRLGKRGAKKLFGNKQNNEENKEGASD